MIDWQIRVMARWRAMHAAHVGGFLDRVSKRIKTLAYDYAGLRALANNASLFYLERGPKGEQRRLLPAFVRSSTRT